MLAIESPYPQFFDTDGSPLSGGSVYFGQVDQNPETAPVTVYWDVAGTQPAAQPIRTLNGFMTRAGGAAFVYAGSNYSVTIRDSKGRLVVYCKNSADFAVAAAITGLADALADTANASNGDALIGVKAIATGAVARTQHSKNAEHLSLDDFGAVGDGITDDTVAIQAALDAASGTVPLHFPAKTYLSGPVFVKSNTVIHMHPSTTVLIAKPTLGINDRLLNIRLVSNVKIYGNGSTVKMNRADYVTGEQRHGVFVATSSNVVIRDLNSIDSGGDGFYVGAALSGASNLGPCRNIRIENCSADNNRRQGMSIVSAIDMWVEGGTFSNTIGTAPAAGIDVEPDADCTIDNVNLTNVKTYNNFGAGIIVVPSALGVAANTVFNLNIEGCTSDSDGAQMNYVGGFQFDGAVVPANQIYGIITVANCEVINCKTAGLRIGGNSWMKMPTLQIRDVHIQDPCANSKDALDPAFKNYEGAGIAIDQSFAIGGVSNVTLRNVTVMDSRATKKLVWPILLWANGAHVLTNVRLMDCDDVHPTTPAAQPVISNALTGTDVSITQTRARTVTLLANDTLSRSPGLICTHTADGVLSLPYANSFVGMEYTFSNTAGTNTLIRPKPTDQILALGQGVGLDVASTTQGDLITVRSIGGTSWVVTELSGKVRPYGVNLSPTPQILGGITVPATGTWVRGDVVLNTAATAGGVPGWMCITGGTPGTWKAMANLAA